MKTLHMAQGSVEWHAARMGVVTASEADCLVTPKWKVKEGAGPGTYETIGSARFPELSRALNKKLAGL